MDAQALVGGLVPSGSVFEFLAEHRQELFPDSFIADLFPSKTGRPSLPADLIGSVLVLKELYDLSDPQTAEALRFDIRWKVACGRSLSQTSFDPSTLVYWRKRIAESDRPDRVFDAVAAVISMGSPVSGSRRANNAWPLYRLAAGHAVEDAPMALHPDPKPPVPTIAVWSRRDGIVAPACAAGRPTERDRAVELDCTHIDFGIDPAVADTIAALRAGMSVLSRASSSE